VSAPPLSTSVAYGCTPNLQLHLRSNLLLSTLPCSRNFFDLQAPAAGVRCPARRHHHTMRVQRRLSGSHNRAPGRTEFTNSNARPHTDRSSGMRGCNPCSWLDPPAGRLRYIASEPEPASCCRPAKIGGARVGGFEWDGHQVSSPSCDRRESELGVAEVRKMGRDARAAEGLAVLRGV